MKLVRRVKDQEIQAAIQGLDIAIRLGQEEATTAHRVIVAINFVGNVVGYQARSWYPTY